MIESEIFRRTLINTFIFTIRLADPGAAAGQDRGAAADAATFPGGGIARALIILPWAVPVSLATLAWQWMFDSLYSVINWTLQAVGLIDARHWPQWLGQQDLAMIAVITVHAWRLFPFAVVIFLAGLTSVPKDVLDAATIDGAGFWRRNYQIILPMIAPIILIALIFGTVFTFTDLSVVYLLTKGGPINSTQVLGSLAFQVGILSGDVSHGAVICLFLFPVPAGRRDLPAARAAPAGDLTCTHSQEVRRRRTGSTRAVVASGHVRGIPVLLDADHDVQDGRRSLQSQLHTLLVQCGADARAPASICSSRRCSCGGWGTRR